MATSEESAEPALTPVRRALAIAALVLAFGFVMLNVFWLWGDWDPDLLGLYDFRSATFGDGLVLPTLTFLLVRLGRWQERWDRRRLLVCALAGVLGAMAGATTQISWLTASHITPNWTFPEAGSFNWVGWYHAVYLVAMTGLLATLAARAWLAMRTLDSELPAGHRLEASLLVLLSPLFLALWSIDFIGSGTPVPGFLSAIAWTAAIPVFIVLLTAPRTWRVAASPTLSSLGLAAAVCAVVVYAPAQERTAVLSWFATAVVAPNFAVPLWMRAPWQRVVVLCAGLLGWATAVGVLVYQVDLAYQWQLAAHLLGVVVVALVLIPVTNLPERTNVWKNRRGRTAYETIINVLALVGVVGFGLWAASNAAANYADAVFVVWSLAVVSAITFEKALLRQLIRSEDRGDEDQKDRRRIRVYQWGLLYLVSVLVILALGEIEVLAREEAGADHPVAGDGLPLVVAVQLLGLLALMLLRLAGDRLTRPVRVALAWAVIGIMGTAAFLGAWSLVLTLTTGPRGLLILATLVLPAGGLGAFVLLSMVSNPYFLRNRRPPIGATLIGVATSLLVASGSLVACLTILLGTGALRAVGGMVLVGMTFVPLLVVENSSDEDLDSYLVRGSSPRGGLLQDALLSVAMCAVLLTYPVYNLLMHPDLETVVVRSVAVLGMVAGLYGWALSANVEHASKYEPATPEEAAEVEVCGDVRMTKERLHVLIRRHTRTQNIISAVMLIPVVPYLLATLDVEEVGLALLGQDIDDGTAS